MKHLDFQKDRISVYGIWLGAGIVVGIFLRAFQVNWQAIGITIGVILIAVVLSELWEYRRKRSFYEKLENNLSELDQKYLIANMISEPDFYEGKILYEALYESNKSMCEQVAEYRRQNQTFKDYIEMWVHEIKLPVSSLLLMCHNNPALGERFIMQLHRIDGLIEHVLYYARSENAEKDYIIKEVSLKRVLTDVAVKNRESLQLNQIELQAEGLAIQVLTDGKWLEFMLGQLMANSIKYISHERKPEISVWAEEFPDQTVLHFRDNGIGIPESDLPYIYEKSFTGENGRSTSKSTGMGLYIVKNLCDRLGHNISVKSVQGEFTEVMITFAKHDWFFRQC